MNKPKDINRSRYLYILGKEVALSRHALIQARARGIDADLLERTIHNGKVHRFAKNHIKITRKYKQREISCIAEEVGENIIIKTVVERK